MTTPTSSPFRLELSRFYNFPREKVFQAFLEPAAIEAWLAPDDSWRTIVHELNAVAGGAYRFEFHGPEGQRDILTGQYQTVNAPERIAFTWRWADNPIERDTTLVTLTFHERDAGTELILHHTNLSVVGSIDLHGRGWTGAFDRLPNHLNGQRT